MGMPSNKVAVDEAAYWALEEALLDYVRLYGMTDNARKALTGSRPERLSGDGSSARASLRLVEGVGAWRNRLC
ncbi:hypothetical protein [Oceaniglobus indicus]|uniref:hypothetical protein n=1 Tax=Oceaniglobus indicus TaxID=2047749 RepID=UPI0011AB5CCA|nr:hypothetical protein [Oceaniglobus indicus]